MGARFAKWRAVITIGDQLPTRGCIDANAQALARYAALCQEEGLVPIVEPEVLMDDEHSLEGCQKATGTLHAVFNQLYEQRVMLEGMILKPNMVLPGLACLDQETVDGVADATVKCLLRVVPAAVPEFISVRRPIRRTRLRPLERHESALQGTIALGCGVFICPGHSAAGLGGLARPGGECGIGSACSS